jgi:hypothetical protein
MRLKRHGVASWLEHLAIDELDEPTDLLYASREDLSTLLLDMLRHGLPFDLGRLPAESLVPEVLRQCRPPFTWVRCHERPKYPVLALNRFPEGEVNAGRKSDLRRMRRRAERRGAIRVEVRCPPVSDVDGLLETAMMIEAAGWKTEAGRSLRQNQIVQRFLRDYLPRAAEAGILRMAFLHVGERPAAMQIAVACGGGYWLLKIGYDEALSGVSPGQLLMQETIRACVDAGLETYEMMGRCSSWTRVWTTTDLTSSRVEAFPPGLPSLLNLGALALRKLLKRLRRRKDPPLRDGR